MYTEKEILCLLKLNKERVAVFFDDEKNEFSLIVKPNLKLKKSKHIDTYRISDTQEKYLKLLKLNPKVLKLEYSEMDYFILISKIPRKELSIPKGMKYEPAIGFYDRTSILNVSREY